MNEIKYLHKRTRFVVAITIILIITTSLTVIATPHKESSNLNPQSPAPTNSGEWILLGEWDRVLISGLLTWTNTKTDSGFIFYRDVEIYGNLGRPNLFGRRLLMIGTGGPVIKLFEDTQIKLNIGRIPVITLWRSRSFDWDSGEARHFFRYAPAMDVQLYEFNE